jgi:transposase
MNLHSGARTCPASRTLLIERIAHRGWRVTAAARAAGVSPSTAYKWISRHALEGVAGLVDRSSRPRTSPTALTLDEVCCVRYLRHTRMTAARIASSLELPRSTVARVLKRQGLNRLKSLEPQEPPSRAVGTAARAAAGRPRSTFRPPRSSGSRGSRPRGPRYKMTALVRTAIHAVAVSWEPSWILRLRRRARGRAAPSM